MSGEVKTSYLKVKRPQRRNAPTSSLKGALALIHIYMVISKQLKVKLGVHALITNH
jgi:hypothetical protein